MKNRKPNMERENMDYNFKISTFNKSENKLGFNDQKALMLKRLLYSEKDILADIKLGGRAEDRAITYLIKKYRKRP